MKIETGKEDRNGEFCCRMIGESHNGETPKQAIIRVACRFLGRPLSKRSRWIAEWGRLGPHDEPTEYLPGLFIGSRLFQVGTEWDGKGGWQLS